MPATLESTTNQELMNIANGLPNIDIQLQPDDDAFDAFVVAADEEIVNRFGPHPAAGADGYAQRKLALAEVVGIDMSSRGDSRARRTRALSRIGVVMAGGYSADAADDGAGAGGSTGGRPVLIAGNLAPAGDGD